MQKPTVEIVTATKKLITELRALDTHNRKKKKNHVDYLRREIRDGKWTLTNQGVGVTASGFVCDGGHRLEAIELEGYPPVQFILARGLPDNAQKYVDQHAKRTMADTLTLFFDQSISSKIIAGLNVILKQQSGWTPIKTTPDELINQFEEMEHAVKRVVGIEKSNSLAAPVWAAFVEMFHETNDERVLGFAEQVIRGEMLQSGDPALTLRNWLSATSAACGGFGVQRERYIKTRAALLAFLEDRRLTKLYARKIQD
jgi:hypothetical protein